MFRGGSIVFVSGLPCFPGRVPVTNAARCLPVPWHGLLCGRAAAVQVYRTPSVTAGTGCGPDPLRGCGWSETVSPPNETDLFYTE